MITYGRFQFASPPRTGTTWFLKAAHSLGLGPGNKTKVHIPPSPVHRVIFLVTIVRHPYDWLSSYYHVIDGGMIGVPEVDRISEICRESKTFEEFISLCVEDEGCVQKAFDVYRPTSVLRLEDFPDAAVEFFESVVPKWRHPDWNEITSLPRQNCHCVPTPHRSVKHKSLRDRVVRSEQELCDRYDYV